MASGIKRFVIHCFSEHREFAEDIFSISEEAKISFTGILTYQKSTQIHEVAKTCPLDKIMIETDAPYLIPETYKGKVSYCEPVYSLEVFKTLCELRKEEPQTIEQALWSNSSHFFHL